MESARPASVNVTIAAMTAFGVLIAGACSEVSPAPDGSLAEDSADVARDLPATEGPGADARAADAEATDVGPVDDLPYLQRTISFNESLCDAVASGAKKITLRNNHWTWVQAGEWVKLRCSTSGTSFKTQLTSVRHTTWGGVTAEEYQADGFATQAEMLQKLQTYYPGITLSDPATVIRWGSVEPLL